MLPKRPPMTYNAHGGCPSESPPPYASVTKLKRPGGGEDETPPWGYGHAVTATETLMRKYKSAQNSGEEEDQDQRKPDFPEV